MQFSSTGLSLRFELFSIDVLLEPAVGSSKQDQLLFMHKQVPCHGLQQQQSVACQLASINALQRKPDMNRLSQSTSGDAVPDMLLACSCLRSSLQPVHA